MFARFVPCLLIWALAIASAPAETNTAAATLIARIPNDHEVEALRDRAKNDPSDSEREKAQQKLLAAIKDCRALQPLLKIGSSVFDYPGLLALSWSSSYDPKEHLYRIRIGMYALIAEGSDQWIFKVCFDDHGIIRKIEPVLLSL